MPEFTPIRIFWPTPLPDHQAGVNSTFPRKSPYDALISHPYTHPNRIPSEKPKKIQFKKPYPLKPLPNNRPTTHQVHLPSLLALAPPLLHLTHGIYQATLMPTRVTLYSYSRVDPTSRSSPWCSQVSSHAKGLRRDYKPANSHSLSLFFTVAST